MVYEFEERLETLPLLSMGDSLREAMRDMELLATGDRGDELMMHYPNTPYEEQNIPRVVESFWPTRFQSVNKHTVGAAEPSQLDAVRVD